MTLIAIFFLVFALLMLARVPRGYQAVWLGLTLFSFGCCILGLISYITRFGNYQLEGLVLTLEQPSWAWRLLTNIPLNIFIRFRLWSAALFVVAMIGFAFSYSTKKWRKLDYGFFSFILLLIAGLLWFYDPDHLFMLFKTGSALLGNTAARERWEGLVLLSDRIALLLIIAFLILALGKIILVWRKTSILQKKAQALGVAVGTGILCIFFSVLFLSGPVGILNAHTMANTLLPVANYPIFDTTYLQALPYAGLIAFGAVMLSIFRYGFLGTWRVGTRELDRQINMANQAVRLSLHTFKNRFLAIEMAMKMAAKDLEPLGNDEVIKARSQVEWVQNVCVEALTQLNILHIHSNQLQVNIRLLAWNDLWQEAKHRCAGRLEGIIIREQCTTDEKYVMGDREYLIAVLENLLQNAVDAMMERDITPYILVEIGCEYEWGYIRITDNGLGISKENLPKVLSPFFTTKATKKNWGLGLAFCHRVINAHRGFLNIWTSPGNGTTVEVVMRCREKLDAFPEHRWKNRFLLRKHPPTHQCNYGG